MALKKSDVFAFVRRCGAGVVSSVAEDGSSQAAYVNLAMTPALELIFYTLESARKCRNLRADPRIAAVISGDNEQTVQYEGVAAEPLDAALDETKKIFVAERPNLAGLIEWPGLVFFRVRPVWIRFSTYAKPWQVQEFDFPENVPRHPRRHH